MPQREIDEDFLHTLAVDISELSRRLMAILRTGADHAFPLTPQEMAAIHDFRSRYLRLPPIENVVEASPDLSGDGATLGGS